MRLRHILVAFVLPFASLRSQPTWSVDPKPILDVPGVGANGVVNFENFVGRAVARVLLPMSMTVSEIGRDYILGTYSDANDETHVAVLRLTRK